MITKTLHLTIATFYFRSLITAKVVVNNFDFGNLTANYGKIGKTSSDWCKLVICTVNLALFENTS